MEKEDDASTYSMVPHGNFAGLEYYTMDTNLHHHHQHQSFMEGDTASPADYMLHHHHQPPPQTTSSFDRLAFAEAMQFADYGNKMVMSQPAKASDEYNGMDDPVYFLKFPVLNERSPPPPEPPMLALPPPSELGAVLPEESRFGEGMVQVDQEVEDVHHHAAGHKEKAGMKLRLFGGQNTGGSSEGKNRRKRPRSAKTSEEVESQRMTHIAVERNRRKQMNEHLRVLRSLMPSSYVQRGDQASIIGGAIEFVRELEQLLQCLESQKRRRLYGGDNGPPRPMGEPPAMAMEGSPGQFLASPPLSIAGDQNGLMNFDAGLQEETAEIKSCLADVEVKLLGFDALIKILSRRRPGQLLKTIAALEDLQLNILHTNITTIEQTVLYSFNVKVTGEGGFTAEDIANSVHQILNFIHASTAV